jgi:ParB-like chromosome segregation protein Spo0J
MQIRDRIRELRRVRAKELRPNPRNWRTHPQAQRDAMCGVLAEIGYADALLVRELTDGSLELIDGHLRAETTPDMEVPVLIVDLTDAEAAMLLTLHDPLAAMAEENGEMLADLVANVETENSAVRALLDRMIEGPELPAEENFDGEISREVDVPEAFQVVVECRDEAEQQTVYERLNGEGYKCKLLTL